jgi:HK97 gp10 family phage protein
MAAGDITGMNELRAAFKRLPDVVRDRLNEATDTTAREIVRNAKSRIQSSPSIVTRELFNSVDLSLSRANGRALVGIRANSPARKRAHFVEFGTSHSSAEPFMIPSVEAERVPYLQRCRVAGRHIERDMTAGRFL